MLLKNKVVLITGSSRGIGAAVARLAHKEGAEIILHGKTESKELMDFSKELKVNFICCDIVNEKEVKRVTDHFDKIDVLINTAGINLSQPFLQQSTDSWKKTFEVNVLGTVNFTKAIIPKMQKASYGKIVNFSSIKGFPNTAGSPAYAASKAAIINLTASLAKEFSPEILVNCIAPGFTDTEMTKNSMSERISKQISEIPLQRIALPEEIAEVALFLASDKASYITGQTFLVDGGYTLKI